VNDYEKTQAFLELYKLQWDRYDKRRDFEWKVTLGLWTGIAVITGFLAGKVQVTVLHLVIYIAIWVVYTFCWSAGSWQKNEEDKEYALVYLRKAEQLLNHIKDERTFSKPNYWGFLKNWSRRSQILATALFLLISWYVLAVLPVDHSVIIGRNKNISEQVTPLDRIQPSASRSAAPGK
jgi:hypothetical protein